MSEPNGLDAIYNGFRDWNDVAENFADVGYIDGPDDPRMKAALAVVPEPDEVYVAAYEQEGYECEAFVAYRTGDRYYINTGSHCSCFGLEGQWDPQEFESAELFRAYLERIRDDGYGVEQRHASEVLERLASPPRADTETQGRF